MIFLKKNFGKFLFLCLWGISFSGYGQNLEPKTRGNGVQKPFDSNSMDLAKKVMATYQKIKVLQSDFFQIITGYGPQTGQRTRKSSGVLFSKRSEGSSQIRITYKIPEDRRKDFLVNKENKLKMYDAEENRGCEQDISKDSEIEAIRQLLQGTVPLNRYFQMTVEAPTVLADYLRNEKVKKEEEKFAPKEEGEQILKLVPLSLDKNPSVEKNPYASYQNIILVISPTFLIKKVILLNQENSVNWYSLNSMKLDSDAKDVTDATFQMIFPKDAMMKCQ